MSATEVVETVVLGRFTGAASGTGMAGGSLVAFLASQDLVAWTGVFVALASLILLAFHRRAMRRITERDLIERRKMDIARMSPEQCRAYLDLG